MQSSQAEQVRAAIARHLAIEPAAIELSHHLQEDWGMNSLDLVLILARLEDTAHLELPLDLLRNLQTVGELVAILEVARHVRGRPIRGWPPSAALVNERLRRSTRHARRELTRRAARAADAFHA